MATSYTYRRIPHIKFSEKVTNTPPVDGRIQNDADFFRAYDLDNPRFLGMYVLDFVSNINTGLPYDIANNLFPGQFTEYEAEATRIINEATAAAKARLQAKYNAANSDYVVKDEDVQLAFLTAVTQLTDPNSLYNPLIGRDGTVISFNILDPCEKTDYDETLETFSVEILGAGAAYSRNRNCFPIDEFDEVFIDELKYEEIKLADGGTQINIYKRKGLKNRRTEEITPIVPPKFELIKTFIVPPSQPIEPLFYAYKKFLPSEIITNEFISKTYGIWGDNGELLDFYTSSLTSEIEKQYMLTAVSTSCSTDAMFSVYYGDYNGNGSTNIAGSRGNKSYTKMIYSKFASLCLDKGDKFILNDGFDWPFTPDDDTFDFENDLFKVDTLFYTKQSGGFNQEFPTRKVNRIFAIQVPRALYGDKLDEGNVELNFARLNPLTGAPLDEAFSFNLIDSSLNKNNVTSSAFVESVSYDLVSGSILSGKYTSNLNIAFTSYGKFYPNLGVFILDADKLNSVLNLGIESGSNLAGYNPSKLFNSMSGSATISVSRQEPLGFKSRKVDNQLLSYYHVNIRPKDFNYSNNPTFVEDEITTTTTATGQYTGHKIKNTEFLTNPTSYITTIGLYDDNYRLLAVGKLSKAIKKTDLDKKTFIVKLNTNAA
jgi:hypothetical protein